MKRKFFLVQSIIFFAPLFLKAQEVFVEPPAKEITTIPFTQLTGGIIIMQARLGDHPDTLNFIMDTGSTGISLDSTTADYLKLKPVPTERTIKGIAGTHKVSFLFNQKLKLPNLTIDSLNFHINNYEILTSVYGERIDGIIGYAVLSRYIVMLNYDSLRVSFYSQGSLKYPKGGYLLKPNINMLAAQPLRVKDYRSVNTRFLYDIGAGVCMLLSKEFVSDSNFLEKGKKYFTKEGEGLGGKLDMQLTVIKEVRIGPYRFHRVPVHVFDDAHDVTSYPYMGGLIGNDILRRFNTIINYKKGDIFLMPNSHFIESFDYSYSGVELYLVNGIIIVGDVAKGSPAELAGLKEGDEVLAVNKNFSQILNQYKLALQTPNDKVKVIYRREGVINEVEFKVKSIL
ncbi:MAG TPA: aspartyl protease family protein [Chitinophagaceae bacterium]|nr:aspartyl protease family protein [Chitinophagaceae bacterium]